MAKVLIYMDGGIIQYINCDEPVEIYVVDFDIEGVADDHPHLTKFDGEECLLFKLDPNENPDAVNLAEKTWGQA
jgi:hypothetical protein